MNKELLANINRRHHFDEKEGLEILNLPELNLTPEEEMEIFDFPEEEATSLFIKYITRIHIGYPWKLCDEAEVKIFDFSPENVKKIMLRYIDLLPEIRLCPEAELKILDLPIEIAKEIMFKYFKLHSLRSKAELKIFNLPLETIQELMIEYAKKGQIRSLCPKAQIMIFDNPEVGKIIWQYCSEYSRTGFCYEARKKAHMLGLHFWDYTIR
ncbi:MAG: hypothetical protein J6Y53_03440 [Alphaproteobacteria bacterium]|nr:hypothetical protein [Alphaproteobacteria bacterium]